MTLEKTVRLMLLNYPSLYSGAIEAYNHLFLTLGNGYTWENGELISTCRADNNMTEDVMEAIKNTLDFHYFRESPGFDQYIEKTEKEDLKERVYKGRAKRCGTYVTRILMVDWNIKNFEVPEKYEDINAPFQFYPLSTLCNLYNLPSDIKPDYLEAAVTIYNALLENPDKVRDDKGILGEIGEKIDRLKHP